MFLNIFTFFVHCSLHFSYPLVYLLFDIDICIPELFILYQTRIYSSLLRREADHSLHPVPRLKTCGNVSPYLVHLSHGHAVVLHKLNVGTNLPLPLQLIFRLHFSAARHLLILEGYFEFNI
jgi:hypothetical protein